VLRFRVECTPARFDTLLLLCLSYYRYPSLEGGVTVKVAFPLCGVLARKGEQLRQLIWTVKLSCPKCPRFLTGLGGRSPCGNGDCALLRAQLPADAGAEAALQRRLRQWRLLQRRARNFTSRRSRFGRELLRVKTNQTHTMQLTVLLDGGNPRHRRSWRAFRQFLADVEAFVRRPLSFRPRPEKSYVPYAPVGYVGYDRTRWPSCFIVEVRRT
jgi:hypothetical protein